MGQPAVNLFFGNLRATTVVFEFVGCVYNILNIFVSFRVVRRIKSPEKVSCNGTVRGRQFFNV